LIPQGGGHQKPNQFRKRADYDAVVKKNELFEKYYNELSIVPEEEKEAFWQFMRADLPNSFRFTGSKG
jgi:multisite-specific tRNA:(cytosine-C5)-methyltransferase